MKPMDTTAEKSIRQALRDYGTQEQRELFIKAALARLVRLIPYAQRNAQEEKLTSAFAEEVASLADRLAKRISRPEAEALEGTHAGVGLSLEVLARELRMLAESANEARDAVAKSPGKPNAPGKIIVNQLGDAWRLAFGEIPSASKNGRFCRVLGALDGRIPVALPTAERSIKDALRPA